MVRLQIEVAQARAKLADLVERHRVVKPFYATSAAVLAAKIEKAQEELQGATWALQQHQAKRKP